MKETKSKKATTKKETTVKVAPKKIYKITKKNGKVIERYNLGDYVKTYEAKGYKVEEV